LSRLLVERRRKRLIRVIGEEEKTMGRMEIRWGSDGAEIEVYVVVDDAVASSGMVAPLFLLDRC
jgi:hypothetical protein